MSGSGHVAQDAARARVVVVDDHPFFRDGLIRGLQQSGRLEVVGEAGSGREAIALIHEESPHVAVLDYQMPDLDGLDVVRAITRDGLATRCLLLSALTDPAVVFQALQEGASGYLSKEARRSEIVEPCWRWRPGARWCHPRSPRGWSTRSGCVPSDPGQWAAAGWRELAGNHVLIETDAGPVVAVCHLQRDSVHVHPGQRVRVGEELGRCGNSGNSTEPHVHVQAMDRTDVLRAAALPISFAGSLPRNGEVIDVE